MPRKISTSDPRKLRRPGNMSEAVVAKCHAANQLRLIAEELRRLRELRAGWQRRYGECLRVIGEEATAGHH